LAAPVLVAYYPPMTDLPYHEAQIAILRYFNDPARFPPGLYQRNLGEPNQLFHIVGWGLSYLVSTRWTVKLLVAAAVLAIPVSAGNLARHVGSSPLAALVVAPMALGWLFSWGLVANLVGLAALLALLPALDRLGDEPTPRRAASAVAGALLLYFAHMAMMFLYAASALALAVLHPWSWRKSALRLSPLVAGVAITLAQARLHARLVTISERAVPTLWHPLLHKVTRVPYIIMPASDRAVTTSMAALCALVIGAFLWLRARERSAGTPPATAGGRVERIRRWVLAHRWGAFAVSGLLAYFAFPLTMHNATLIYQRWFPPAFAVLAIASAPRDLWSRAARAARIGAAALPVATLLVVWPSFADAGREYRTLDRVLPLIESGSAVAVLELGPADPSRTYALAPSGGRVLAARGGRVAFDFSNSSIAPAVVASEYQWQGPLVRIGFDSWSFRPEHDLKLFRYVLARTADADMARIVMYALLEDARLVGADGDWLLFESRKPVVPLLSPSMKMEHPAPEQLRERVAKLVSGAHDAPPVPAEPAYDPAGVGGPL
jgi:hypothetical protein